MFKNKSALGSFGEFVYKRFCETRGIACERTNYCHTDFLITTESKEKFFYVDVKTTQEHKHEYRGARYHSDIIYESLSVNRDTVTLIPDKNSPFKNSDPIEIGTFEVLYHEWVRNEKNTKIKTSKFSDNELTMLKNIFAKSKYPRVRFVERGDASTKRWTGTVDNLPGTDATIRKSDITVFIQYTCLDFQQVISSITIFPHDWFYLELVPMLKPNQRQKNKGIMQVVDLNLYKNKYPGMTFSDVKSVINFAENEGLTLLHSSSQMTVT